MDLDIELKLFDFLKSFRTFIAPLIKVRSEALIYFQRIHFKPLTVLLTVDFSQLRVMKVSKLVKLTCPLHFKNLKINLPGVEVFGSHSVNSLFGILIDKWSRDILSIEQIQSIVRDSFPRRLLAIMNEEIVECVIISSKRIVSENTGIDSKNFIELYNIDNKSNRQKNTLNKRGKLKTIIGFISEYSREKMTVLPLLTIPEEEQFVIYS